MAAAEKKRNRHAEPSTKRTKPRKTVKKKRDDKIISSGLTSKILKEALIQQNEILNEAAHHQNHPTFYDFEHDPSDDSAGFNHGSQCHIGYHDQEEDATIDEEEEDERLLESFLSLAHRVPQRTLADYIAEKLGENDAAASPKMDISVIDLYKGVGKFLHTYTAGKMPKAFRHIPSMDYWEKVLYLTEPQNWSPKAMFQATRIFASTMGVKKAQRFNMLVLLPTIRDSIKKNKNLHFDLYQSLRKGMLFPLCESGTCSMREAFIIGSVIHNDSIPRNHSSYFIKLLLEKMYALPLSVVDAAVDHFMRFMDYSRTMPVIWHQSLLAFVKGYKIGLRKEDKDDLRKLVREQKTYLRSWIAASTEVNRRQLTLAQSVISKTIEEDRFDIPEVPMEED